MRFQDSVIFSDLDGTLFNHYGFVSPSDIEAIRKYTDQGGLFAVSTGRVPDNMMDALQSVVWNVPGIILNGAAIYDPQKREYLHSVYADREALSDVLHYALSKFPNLDIQVYSESGILYVSSKDTVNRAFWELHKRSRFVSIEEAKKERWFKALLFGRKENLNQVLLYLDEKKLTDHFTQVFAATDIVPGIEYLELLPRNVNKGTAISVCRKLPVFSGRKFLCIGDYNNDKEMLIAADIAVCPKNSHPDILKICDVLVQTNNNNALAGLISRIPSL